MTRPSPRNRASRLRCLTLMLAAALLLAVGADAEASHLTPLVGDRAAPWAAHLSAMERALEGNDIPAALRAWHAAYVAAVESPRWQGMVEVGDAYLRVGAFLRSSERVKAKARELYLTALLRARHQRSTEGVLRVASAFGALGDAEVVDQCLRVLRQLDALGGSGVAGVNVRDGRSSGSLEASRPSPEPDAASGREPVRHERPASAGSSPARSRQEGP